MSSATTFNPALTTGFTSPSYPSRSSSWKLLLKLWKLVPTYVLRKIPELARQRNIKQSPIIYLCRGGILELLSVSQPQYPRVPCNQQPTSAWIPYFQYGSSLRFARTAQLAKATSSSRCNSTQYPGKPTVCSPGGCHQSKETCFRQRTAGFVNIEYSF